LISCTGCTRTSCQGSAAADLLAPASAPAPTDRWVGPRGNQTAAALLLRWPTALQQHTLVRCKHSFLQRGSLLLLLLLLLSLPRLL
jgi:hypothetical protein